MRIGIDIQTLETAERTRGIGRLCERLVACLARHAPEHEYVLYGLSPEVPPMAAALLSSRVSYQQIIPEGPPREHLRLGTTAPFLWTTPGTDELDLYHVTSPLMPDILLPGSAPCPLVATLLDAIPALWHEQGRSLFDEDGWRRYRMRVNILRGYQHFLPISHSAAEDCARLLELSPERMSVSYVPIEQFPASKLSAARIEQVLGKFSLPAQSIVSVTGFHSRKNIHATLRSYALLPPTLRHKHPLVLVCSLLDSERQQLDELARQSGIEKEVLFTGYVSDEELVALVKSAALFVFGSLYEGFGIPVADAMACGTAVVSSNSSSLPEVVGEAGVLVDPTNEAGFANAMERLLSDEAPRRRCESLGYLHVERFAPGHFVERVLAGYKKAVGRRCKSRRSAVHVTEQEPRLRVAHFTPLGPCMSGIAEYSEQLLLHLENVDSECFIEEYTPSHHLVRERIDCYHFSAFAERQREKPFDAVVYQMGNNALHAYMLPFVEQYPGVLVLHDYSLLGLYRHLALQLGERRSAQLRFAQEYPAHDPLVWENDAALGRLGFDEFQMVGQLAGRSRGAIVHSEWLREQMRKITAHEVPIEVIPLGVAMNYVLAPRPPREELRRRYLLPADAFVVVSVGVINRLKRLREVLEAFDDFHDQCPNSYFVLLGPADPLVLRQMNDYCAQRKLKHCVRFLGHRETHELYEVIDLADVCVNLRYPTMGESSATLVSCLAMGKPTLTTPINQFLEFPDSVCWKVRLGATERREMVDYLRCLYAHPEIAQALGAKASEFVRGWGWEHTAKRYESVLRQAASTADAQSCSAEIL